MHIHSPYVLLDVFLIDTGKYIDISIKTASVHLTQTFTLIIFNFALETVYFTHICSVPHYNVSVINSVSLMSTNILRLYLTFYTPFNLQ